MPNTFLGFKYVNPVSITSNQPSFTTDTLNLKRQSVRTGAQRWDIELGLTGGLNSNIFGELMAHYMINGEGTSFDLNVPQNPGVEDAKITTNTPRSSQAKVAGDSSITVDGGTYTLPVGLMFTFNNTGHDKVYMVTEEVVNGGTLKFAPDLVAAVPDNTTLVIDDVTMRVYHNQPNSVVSYARNSLQSVRWSFIEAL